MPKSLKTTQQSSNRNQCTECKKKPLQVQCLHCSQQVCMECAQKHVNSVMDESETVAQLLNEKFDILDRLAVNARQRIVAERDKIVKKADAERDQSFQLLAQIVEQQKEKLRNKNKQLSELPLNEIPRFIQSIKSDVQHLIDTNNTLFNVGSTMPRITLYEDDNTSRMKDRTYFDDFYEVSRPSKPKAVSCILHEDFDD